MNSRLPEPFRAPTPFSTPRSIDSFQIRPSAPISLTTSSLTELIDALTPRRLEVLKLVARGLTNPEIARVLEISTNTIKVHLKGILETLELTNRTEAAMAWQDYEVERRILRR